MADTERIVVSGEGITLPLLIWRRFRKPMPGVVEQAFGINPGLAAQGPFIAPGTVVLIPVADESETVSEPAGRISLW